MARYMYGMRRPSGFSLGCQPMDGLVDHQDDVLSEYYEILFYNRPLTLAEEKQYELDYLGKRREE